MAIASNFPSSRPSLLLDFANVGRLDPRVTFTRASSATFYDGVTTAKAEENLLLQSQDFTTTWANQGTTDTADAATAPDGTNTADELDDGTGTSPHAITQEFSGTAGTTYTVSAFFKDVDRQYVILACSAGPNAWASAKFDLTAGTAGSTSASGTGWSTTSSSITSVGNSWYRCSITFVSGSTASLTVRIGMATDGTTFTAGERGLESYTGTNATIYIWGAQLEQRSAVTAYTLTTTQPITNYIPVLQTAAAGVARFDHDPTTGEALGLLIEEQRTNLFLQSEDFSNAAWTLLAANLTSNTIVAPDGTLTGDKMFEDTANAAHGIRPTTDITVVANVTYTLSVFVKAAERSKFRAYFIDTAGSNGVYADFDLSAGTTSGATNAGSGSGATSSIVNVGNGWYRCVVSGSMGGGITTCRVRLRILDAAGTESYTGNGYSGIFIWGAQLEAGAFATSYIPTTTTALTRSADAASMTGTNFSSWYNQSEGTLYVESSTFNPSSNFSRIASIENSSYSSSIQIARNLTDSRGFGDGVSINQGSGTFPVNTFVKQALAAKVNDFALSTNGSAVAVDTSTNPMLSNVIALGIGASTQPAAFFNGTINKISYYPVRLSNDQLQALTG